MTRERVVPIDPQPRLLQSWARITFLLLLLAGAGYLCRYVQSIDGCGPYHNSTHVADFDGDSDLDVLLFNLLRDGESNVWAGSTLWTNQGRGQFISEDLALPELPPYQYRSAAVGDVDGDGSSDIILLAFNELMFYLNHGGVPGWDPGIFRLRDTIHGGEEQGMLGSVVLGDLDNDGDLDGLVPGCCGMFETAGGFSKTIYAPSFSWVWINEKNNGRRLEGHTLSLRHLGDLRVRSAALGDLDGDGDLDAFAALQPPQGGGPDETADRVLLNDGSGNFRDSGQRLAEVFPLRRTTGGATANLRRFLNPGVTPEVGTTAVALGDLDEDGDLDALVGTTAEARIWTNQGGSQGGQAGIFSDSGQHIPGDYGEAVFLADLDGDGIQDALVAGKHQAVIWLNDGQGTFSLTRQHFRYSERHGLAVGDFDGDGAVDIFAGAYSKAHNIWLNKGGWDLSSR